MPAVLHGTWLRLIASPAGRAAAAAVMILCICLPAIHPLLFGTLPSSHDGAMHLNRLVALDFSVRHGNLWPRYSPVLVYGYGLPVFHYYPPTSLYVMLILHGLGLSFLNSFLLGIAIHTLFGAAGAYLLGKAWAGPAGGIVAALTFTYAPYLLLTRLQRAAVAELFGLALLVWAMWALWRVAMRGRRHDMVLAAVSIALLVITHNITAMVGFAVLLAYSALLWWISPDPPRALARLAAALALGVGLGAFFWLPALAESGAVKVGQYNWATSGETIRGFFQTPREIFSLPRRADVTRLDTDMRVPVGWPQLLLAALGIGLALRMHRRRSSRPLWPFWHWALFSIVLSVVFLFLMTGASEPLWANVPLAAFVQFPWRLQGPLAAVLAVAAGGGVVLAFQRLRSPVARTLAMAAIATIAIGYGLPWLYDAYLPGPQSESIVDVQNYERRTGHVGGTAEAEYIPHWTTVLPDDDRLLGLYAQSEVIPRLQPVDGVEVLEAEWQPTAARLDLSVAEPTTLTFDWLYFPGWHAWLDGEPLAVAPSDPTGLLTLEVPAGEHALRIAYTSTPLRRAALAISVASLGALALLLAYGRFWMTPAAAERFAAQARPGPRWNESGALFAVTALIGLGVFGAKVLVIDRVPTPFRYERFAEGAEDAVDVPVEATMGDVIRLIGFDAPSREVRSGAALPITLYWELAGGEVEGDYSSVVVVRDAANDIIAQQTAFYPGSESVDTWFPGLYVPEPLEIRLPAGTPPGVYTVQAGIYANAQGSNLDVTDAAGQPVGVLIDLLEVEVRRPRQPARAAELEAGTQVDAQVAGSLTLLSATSPPAEAEVGAELPIVWAWRSSASQTLDLTARLVWLDGEEVAGRSEEVPLVTGFPTSEWQRRDVWRGVHQLYVPGELDAGRYEVAVQIYGPSGRALGDRAVLGEMSVTTPQRAWEAPQMDVPIGTTWDDGIALLGADLPATRIVQGDGLRLSLYWTTARPLRDDLTVFLHLVDDQGAIVAQRDQIPAAGARPTTGWAPGEVVTDSYGLLIASGVPPGHYRLRVGWYEARSGERVSLPDGDSYSILPIDVEVVAAP